MMQAFFITGTGTGIGKTLITTALCRQLSDDGKKVTALKPIISGYEAADENNDSALILKSCGRVTTPEAVQSISPWRFAAPLSPDMAAAREGKSVDFEALIAFCRDHEKRRDDILLVEGVGGIMTPLNERYTVLDWMRQLGWPVVLVTGSYLGALSHTLSAVEVVAKQLVIRALIVSESASQEVALEDTVNTLRRFIMPQISIIPVPRIGTSKEIQKYMPSIRGALGL